MIDQELSANNLRIAPAARQRLIEQLGGDRIASRNEIRKLALYCLGADVIEEDDILAIIGDASTVSADDAVDAILKGDRNAFFHATQKIISSKTPIFLVLQGCLKQFQLLDQMRAEMDEKSSRPARSCRHSDAISIFAGNRSSKERCGRGSQRRLPVR